MDYREVLLDYDNSYYALECINEYLDNYIEDDIDNIHCHKDLEENYQCWLDNYEGLDYLIERYERNLSSRGE